MISAGQEVHISDCNVHELQAGLCNAFIDDNAVDQQADPMQPPAQTEGQIQSQPPLTTLDVITPLVCSSDLTQEEHSGCVQTLTNNYASNWQHVPEELKPLFDGLVEIVTGLLFSHCSTRFSSNPQATAQCMLRANSGDGVRVRVFGEYLNYPQFFVYAANIFSSLMLTQCVQLAAGDVGGFDDMIDGVADGMNCGVVAACTPTLDETTQCKDKAHFGLPNYSEADYNSCIRNECAIRGRGISNPWGDTEPPPPSPPPPQTTEQIELRCQPTFTEIQICAQEHPAEGSASIIECARQLCEENRGTSENEEQSQEHVINPFE